MCEKQKIVTKRGTKRCDTWMGRWERTVHQVIWAWIPLQGLALFRQTLASCGEASHVFGTKVTGKKKKNLWPAFLQYHLTGSWAPVLNVTLLESSSKSGVLCRGEGGEEVPWGRGQFQGPHSPHHLSNSLKLLLFTFLWMCPVGHL